MKTPVYFLTVLAMFMLFESYAQSQQQLTLPSKDADKLRELTALFVKAFNNADVDAMMHAYYGDEYYALDGSPPRVDKENWKKYLTTIFEKNRITTDVTPDDIQVSGDLGAIRGHYTLHITRKSQPDSTTVLHSNYVEVWHKLQDGTWKCWWGMNSLIKQERIPAK
ncbi:YybH family protein [Stygiobacter electus]|uniref:DUF4440 domain-containing protein n=1 Tax=Stygiobacter electus TaxID=3032292 RepID=A0AAE3P2Y8_9BACT|nr:DUF4440 domain-containing protein [Stygiobacter electus]MDF1613310.1 DUF4440 domain-containing protein [Stygiobacter electus]